MKNKIKAFLLGGTKQNSINQNLGFLILRFFVGLALCTVFEKFLPKEGIWGPQAWFIQDTANMGFPFPTFFAWLAVLTEFVGGICLMLGFLTRPAALFNVFVTFTATFIYHHGDIGGAGLLSFFFMIMCLSIFLFGPGKFSLDYLLSRKLAKRVIYTSSIIFLLFSFGPSSGQAQSQFKHDTAEFNEADRTRITFYVKNNSPWPRKMTFIIYQPLQEGNNTLVKWFLPFQKVEFELPVNSKIYLATDAQIETVMQGKRIDRDRPFIVVEEDLKGTTVRWKNL